MKYKHDINNMLTVATNLIRSEDENNHISGLKMLDELKEKNQLNIIPVYCENPIVNAVLYDKQNYAADNGIDFIFETSVPAELAVSLTDLCRHSPCVHCLPQEKKCGQIKESQRMYHKKRKHNRLSDTH